MKRPILIANLGFIIGIIWGLYFKISIALFIAFFCIVLSMILCMCRYPRFSKTMWVSTLAIIIHRHLKVLLLSIVFILLGVIFTKYCEDKHDTLYKNITDVEIIGYIISEKQEKAYADSYRVMVVSVNKDGKFKNTRLIVQVKKKDNKFLNYGDLVKITGTFELATEQRNYKGFDYREYLKTQKVYGILNTEYRSIEIIKKDAYSKVFIISNKVRNNLLNQIDKFLPKENAGLFKGMLIGDVTEIDENTITNFKNTNLAHILAVSGSHVVYIIAGCLFILKRTGLSKRNISVITILIIIFFMFITGFTASVVRAGVMGMVLLVASILFRKNDVFTSLSLTCLFMLIFNVYTLFDLSFQLSFGATLGIILTVNIFSLKKDNKIIKYIKEGILICISAQILIIPILIYNFNSFTTYFILANVLAAPLFGAIVIFGFVILFISYIWLGLAVMLGYVLDLALFILTEISRICANLPFAVILIKTPFLVNVISYYILVLLFFWYVWLNKYKFKRSRSC